MKEFKKWIVLLAALFVLSGMMSCEMFESDDEETIEVKGEWDTGYGSIIITDSTISWYGTDGTLSYAYDIESFSNDSWNGSETGEGDYGYMVIKYTTAPTWNDSVNGLYNIFRWQNLNSSESPASFEYGEAYLDGTYHESASESKNTATSSNGYYWFSSATKVD